VLVGFGVMHDAGHGAFSDRRWVNRLFARGLDLIGGNQTLWRTKHGVLHHTYTNLEGLDDDLEGGAHLRMHPDQPRRGWHRFQALYAFPLYSLLALHWVLSDFTEYFGGRIGARRVARPTLGDAVVFLAFKAFWVTLAFVVPLSRHPVEHVLPLFFFVILTVGFCLALVFQLAHVVDAVELPSADRLRCADEEWIVHQLRTTADFGTGSRLLTWYTGGLNHQVIHHLFPKIAHVRYPLVRDVVEGFCREKGLPYHRYPSLLAAVRGHLRRLHSLGRPAPSPVPEHA
jgi:linoleoyl-CoA desaturase